MELAPFGQPAPPSPLLALAFGSPGRTRSPNAQMDVDVAPISTGLEDELANIFGQVLLDSMDAKDAVANFEMLCHRRAQALRMEVSQQLHRPARYMHLQALAAELESQAATWHLVWCLYCNEMPPVGTGGPEVLDTGGRRSARQILADKVSADPALTRCAAVVAWLESMADDALTGGEQGGAGGPLFAEHEGVWLETKHRLGTAGVVGELDPDAPGRQGRGLQPDNARAEERLLGRLWQLVRAGRLQDARALCQACGQPWRAASLAGAAGDWGPLPVGLAAGRLEEELEDGVQAEDLAGEVELGPAASRALWKWSCLQVAQQAARTGTPGARFEAALYGALCGHLPSVLPVCGSWEDACWAHCRAWLDGAADSALGAEQAGFRQKLGAAGGGLEGLAALGGDAVVDVVRRVAGAQGSHLAAAGGPKGLVEGALGAAAGRGQGSAGEGGAAGEAGPLGGVAAARDFDALFAALAASGVPAVAAGARDRMRRCQQHLIKDAMAGLAQHLYGWMVSREEEGGEGAGQQGPGGRAQGAGETEDEAAGLPPAATRLAGFGCHLLLALEGLGALYGAAHNVEGLSESTRIAGLSEQLVALYTARLMERGRMPLVPQYLAHLREPLRTVLAHEALGSLTGRLVEVGAGAGSGAGSLPAVEGAADAACAEVWAAMDRWFSHCAARQAEQAALQAAAREGSSMPPPLVRSYVRTSVRPQEARLLVTSFMDRMRLGPEVSPVARARAARWLFYPYLAAREAGRTGDAEPHVWGDALELCCALGCEMALGNEGTARAAAHLFEAVVPRGFEEAVQDAVDGLRAQAGSLQAEAAAASEAAGNAAVLPGQEAAAAAAAAQASAASAAAAAAELVGAAGGLSELLAELRGWRAFYALNSDCAAWTRSYDGLQAAAGAPGQTVLEAELRTGAQQLLRTTVDQMLKGGWMEGLVDPATAVAEQLRTMELTLTDSGSSSSSSGGAQRQQMDAQGIAPFPQLKGAELAEFEQRLRGALSAALAGSPGLSGEVAGPGGAEGHVTVRLACGKSTQEWQAMVGLAADIVQGVLGDMPQVLVVNMRAGRAASLAVCRRCCLGQAVLRAAALRLAAAELGGDGADGAELVELLAAPGGLASVLSPTMLRTVLRLEADTAVAAMRNAQRGRGRHA